MRLKNIIRRFFLIFLCSLLTFHFSVLWAQKPELVLPIKHTEMITQVCISSNGNYSLSGSEDHTVILWDIKTGKLIRKFTGLESYVESVCFSSNDKYILASDAQNIMIWDINNAHIIFSFKGEWKYHNAVSFFKNDEYVLFLGDNQNIECWNIKTHSKAYSIKVHCGSDLPYCFSPDGLLLLSVQTDNSINLMQVETGELVHSFRGHSELINSISFSKNGNYIASSSYDQRLIIWEIKTGTKIKSIDISGYSDFNSLSPDGSMILANNDSELGLWEVQSGNLIRSFSGQYYPTHGCFSNDSKFILSSFSWGDIILWNTESGDSIRTFDKDHSFHLLSTCCSNDGHFILLDYYKEENSLKLWDLQKGKSYLKSKVVSYEFANSFINDSTIIAGGFTFSIWKERFGNLIPSSGKYDIISSDGRYGILRLSDQNFTLWDLNNETEIGSFYKDCLKYSPIAFSHNGEYILLKGTNDTVKIWSTKYAKEIQSFSVVDVDEKPTCFSPDGNYVLSVVSIDTIRINHPIPPLMDNAKPRGAGDVLIIDNYKQLKKETYEIPSSATFSPDGSIVIAYNCKIIRLWNVLTGRMIKTFSMNDKKDTSFICSPAENKLIVENPDQYHFAIWDIKTGKRLQEYNSHLYNFLYTDLFSPDGKYLIMPCLDSIRLFNIQKMKQERSFKFNENIKANWINPDGRIIALTTPEITNNLVNIWDITNGIKIASLVDVDSLDWIITTPSGLFDASPGAMKLMYFVVGMDIIEFDQLKDRYWQPGLLPILLGYSNEPLRQVPAFDYVRLCPDKKLSINDDELNIHLTNRGGGLGKVSVYLDNIELIKDARNSVSDSSKSELDIIVDLNRFANKLYYNHINVIKVIAWNAEEYISSRPDTVHYFPHLKNEKGWVIEEESEKITEQPAFWAIVVGTTNYSGTEIDLNFAAKDATDFSHALQLGAYRLFGKDSTHISLFTTDDPNNLPHKNTVKSAFDQLKQAKPKDVVVFYFSGHGINAGGQDGDFYYLTMDASSLMTNHMNDSYFRNYTISSNELTDWINAIPARKKVLILDACSAGQAAEDIHYAMNTQKEVPGSQIRALDRMKDRTGFYILAGSAADKVSYETSLYGQGVLTYALLRGIKGGSLRMDGAEEYVDIKKLFEYAEDEVPKLAENIGGIQRPFSRGIEDCGSFDIGRMAQEDKEKIVISEPKPVFVACTFQDEDQLFDVLGLSSLINAELREITAKGKEAEFCFTEGKDYPDAYRISGTFTVQENQVKVNYIIIKGITRIGEKYSILGDKNDLKQMIGQLLAEVKIKISNR